MHSTCNFLKAGALLVLIKDAENFCCKKHQFDLRLEPKPHIPKISTINAKAHGGDSYFKVDFNQYLRFTIKKEIHLVSETPILTSQLNKFILNPLVT